MTVDFAVASRVEVDDAAELAALLAAAPGPVRLAGGGSSQAALPAPPAPVQLVSLKRLARIERLDVEDLTCSVGPGLPRHELDAALDEHRLMLPFPDQGTLGGSFARGAPPLAPGAASPRSTLLGFDGVLGDGTRFKAGARVVKSVAGYDLPKLFVGSRGRLFAATLLHLKLSPRPPASVWFARDDLEPEAALGRFHQLRAGVEPPAVLALALLAGGGRASVYGRLDGRAVSVARRLATAGVECGPRPCMLAARPDDEVTSGRILPSRLGALIASLPAGARLLATGAGAFEVASPAGSTDDLLARLPALGAAGEVRHAPAARRGRATPSDPGVAQLTAALRRQFDPRGVLA
jgi:FAD/FMN-containing dehydrogenase